MPKGEYNQVPGEDIRSCFAMGPQRQFTLRLQWPEARAFIWLAIIVRGIPLKEMLAHLVREELARHGKSVDSPEFVNPEKERTGSPV